MSAILPLAIVTSRTRRGAQVLPAASSADPIASSGRPRGSGGCPRSSPAGSTLAQPGAYPARNSAASSNSRSATSPCPSRAEASAAHAKECRLEPVHPPPAGASPESRYAFGEQRSAHCSRPIVATARASRRRISRHPGTRVQTRTSTLRRSRADPRPASSMSPPRAGIAPDGRGPDDSRHRRPASPSRAKLRSTDRRRPPGVRASRRIASPVRARLSPPCPHGGAG